MIEVIKLRGEIESMSKWLGTTSLTEELLSEDVLLGLDRAVLSLSFLTFGGFLGRGGTTLRRGHLPGGCIYGLLGGCGIGLFGPLRLDGLFLLLLLVIALIVAGLLGSLLLHGKKRGVHGIRRLGSVFEGVVALHLELLLLLLYDSFGCISLLVVGGFCLFGHILPCFP